MVEEEKLKSAFWHWDTHKITIIEKTETMKGFVDYLNKHKEVTESELKAMSSNFSLEDEGAFRIISYIEGMENDGEDGRKSYAWAVTETGVAPIIDYECRKIDYIIQDVELPCMYYLIGTENQDPEQQGIFIYGLFLIDKCVKVQQELILAKPQGDFILKDHGIYSHKNVEIKELDENGRFITFTDGEETMQLFLSKDKYYRDLEHKDDFYGIDIVSVREQVKQWSQQVIDESKKIDAIVRLCIHINCFSASDDEEFLKVTDQLKIVHKGKLRLICGTENPEVYGEKDKKSFCWITDERGNMKTLYVFETYQMPRIEQDSEREDVYYLFSKDYGTTSKKNEIQWKVTLKEDRIDVMRVEEKK